MNTLQPFIACGVVSNRLKHRTFSLKILHFMVKKYALYAYCYTFLQKMIFLDKKSQ